MSRGKAKRGDVLAALHRGVRRMGIQTVMFHQALAEKLGLNATDSRAMSILDETGPMSAGQLAESTGLTTGAVTGIIDRLERGGWVRRDVDPRDRRKVIIQPVRDAERDQAVGRLFESLGRNFERLVAQYDDEELALILDFIARGTELMREETTKLRERGSTAVDDA